MPDLQKRESPRHSPRKLLGAEADSVKEWFSSPEKMIQLIAAAEGAHGGPGGTESGGSGIGLGSGLGSGLGGGSGTGTGTGSGSGAAGTGAGGTGGGTAVRVAAERAVAAVRDQDSALELARDQAVATGAASGVGGTGAGGMLGGSYVSGPPSGPAAISKLEEADLQNLLRLLAQFGEAQQTKSPQNNPAVWQQRLAALPQNSQVTLRQALAGWRRNPRRQKWTK